MSQIVGYYNAKEFPISIQNMEDRGPLEIPPLSVVADVSGNLIKSHPVLDAHITMKLLVPLRQGDEPHKKHLELMKRKVRQETIPTVPARTATATQLTHVPPPSNLPPGVTIVKQPDGSSAYEYKGRPFHSRAALDVHLDNEPDEI